jgi:hypothetical protein
MDVTWEIFMVKVIFTIMPKITNGNIREYFKGSSRESVLGNCFGEKDPKACSDTHTSKNTRI